MATKQRSAVSTPNHAASMSRGNSSKNLTGRLPTNGKHSSHGHDQGSEKAISVVCRIRPISQKEIREGSESVTSVDGNGTSVDVGRGDAKLSFDFDAAISPKGSQQDVYDRAAKDIVEAYLDGYNGTVFAYGQTGSGKTYTMEGLVGDPERRGIVPRMIGSIFQHTSKSPDWMEFKLQVQMMEIYNEKIRDLLHPGGADNLRLREERGGGIYVEGCTSQAVCNEREVQELMEMGAATRATAETIMNEASSRSHSVFIITLEQTNKTDGVYKKSKLFMVDLAGSEMVRKTGAKGTTLLEAQHINKSLSQLNKVILALSEGKASHIPYRDSKLTRLLQEAIGGNCRTALIICCSPAFNAQAETMSTMRFGKNAKRIKNRARMNKEQNPAELKLMLEEMRKKNSELVSIIAAKDFEIETLKSLAGGGGGVGGGGGKKGGGVPTDREAALKMVELKEEMVREMEKREKVEEEMAALEQMIAEAEQEHEDELDDLRSEVDRLQYALAQKDQELFYTKTSMINGIMRQSQQGTPAQRPENDVVERVLAEVQKLEAQASTVGGENAPKDKKTKGGKEVQGLLDGIKALSKLMKAQLKGPSAVELHGAVTSKLGMEHQDNKDDSSGQIPYSHGTKPQPRSVTDEDSKDESSTRDLSSLKGGKAPAGKAKVGVQGQGFGQQQKGVLELAAEKAAREMRASKDLGGVPKQVGIGEHELARKASSRMGSAAPSGISTPLRRKDDRPGSAESL